jgi:hypothetical protein
MQAAGCEQAAQSAEPLQTDLLQQMAQSCSQQRQRWAHQRERPSSCAGARQWQRKMPAETSALSGVPAPRQLRQLHSSEQPQMLLLHCPAQSLKERKGGAFLRAPALWRQASVWTSAHFPGLQWAAALLRSPPHLQPQPLLVLPLHQRGPRLPLLPPCCRQAGTSG